MSTHREANQYEPLFEQRHRQCPVLDALGIYYSDSRSGIPMCKNCRISYCVFDRWGEGKAVDDNDWQTLLEWRDELLKVIKKKGGMI